MTRRWLYGLMVALAAVTMSSAVVAATDTGAATPWPAVQTQSKVVEGRFTQRKYLAELEQPLVSSGHYVVAQGHGLLWQIEQPVQAQLVITDKQLIRRSNGHVVTRVSVEQQPALGVVAAVLLAVFQADLGQLQHYFEIQKQSRDGQHWSMTLQPTADGVRRFIKRVRIDGSAHIERIEIHQAGGDYSVLELQAGTTSADALSNKQWRELQR